MRYHVPSEIHSTGTVPRQGPCVANGLDYICSSNPNNGIPLHLKTEAHNSLTIHGTNFWGKTKIRIIFRLIEYSSGLNSTIPQHEAYQYCLDSLPMLIASILLNIIHPGRIMPGKESDLPSFKARKDGGGYRNDSSSAQNRVGEDFDLIWFDSIW